jgi:hypothetical protein
MATKTRNRYTQDNLFAEESLPPGELHPAQMQDPEDIKRFMFGGNARFTLVSVPTQQRFTYRIKKAGEFMPDGRPSSVGWFVGVLTGPDNTKDFVYLGHIYKASRDYVQGSKSRLAVDAPSAIAFEWFYNRALDGRIPPQMEFWHEGRCCRCSHPLTVPESIRRGIGPECAKMMGVKL